MTVKKKFVIMYFEFMKSQDIEKLEGTIRKLVKNRQFPAFRKFIPMIHYKNLKVVGFNQPVVINKDELNRIKS